MIRKLLNRFFPPRNSIIVTATRNDVETAGPYCDCSRCLLATTLKNAGYSDAVVTGYTAIVSGQTYTIDSSAVYDSYYRNDYGSPIIVRHDSVGKRFVLTPA